ncbi:MAG: aminoacetone oxidase family FAD-binding enzyme [Peptoclostridium sp.]|uniref:NAD(P)/FAD-dependent oxidoreductase n=1 Tax=Peptoclostridium sp. TaxID=1904860 RepID=UPI00139C500C|nr:NAD(P)/FAD-dependent oxidoreductase [Peptoclostridium sp.]MZQ75112.1 aminoacetone oxidase family FAD-binding enzyme [Peptoclostridium sp.]
MKSNDVVVIGAGPAGVMAAIAAAQRGKSVLVLEKNSEIGKKLKITGGGRCNITNNRDIGDFFEHIVTNSKFLFSALYSFTNSQLIDFLEEKGVEFSVEDDLKVYTRSGKAQEIIDVLRCELEKNKVNIVFNKKAAELIVESGVVAGVKTSDGCEYAAASVIVATGGKSYPGTGSDGQFFNCIEALGHSIKEPIAALVPLVISDEWTINLQGVSLRDIRVRAYNGTRLAGEENGDVIFTHFGISGPAALNISSRINRMLKAKAVRLELDLLPGMSESEIAREIRKNPNKSIANNLKDILPLNFTRCLLEHLEIQEQPNALTKQRELDIISGIKKLTLTCTSTYSMESAIVTSGGADVSFIDPHTMESTIIKGLYLVGEVIDVDALTGGYNLQIAFSTGYIAGINV